MWYGNCPSVKCHAQIVLEVLVSSYIRLYCRDFAPIMKRVGHRYFFNTPSVSIWVQCSISECKNLAVVKIAIGSNETRRLCRDHHDAYVERHKAHTPVFRRASSMLNMDG